MPEENEKSNVFYGTKLLYTLLRFFFTLYERFLMAFEMCQYFENNPRCEALTEEVIILLICLNLNSFLKEKTEIAHDRYEMFKLTLLNFIKQKFDTNKFEDFIRGIFGNNAFLFFTVDKILSLVKLLFLKKKIQILNKKKKKRQLRHVKVSQTTICL